MFARTIAITLAAFMVSGMLAEAALADQRKKHKRQVERFYGPPEIFVGVPGLRLFFGDYALTPEEFDALYGRGTEFDDSYYEPEPIAPKPRKRPEIAERQVTEPPAGEIGIDEADERTTASIAPRSTAGAQPSASGNGLTCDKAGAIVRGYGFTDVKPASCNGKVYAFNATRGGKSFAIKLDAASGELTEVKKQP